LFAGGFGVPFNALCGCCPGLPVFFFKLLIRSTFSWPVWTWQSTA
jgi:hypothetical protein